MLYCLIREIYTGIWLVVLVDSYIEFKGRDLYTIGERREMYQKIFSAHEMKAEDYFDYLIFCFKFALMMKLDFPAAERNFSEHFSVV